MRQKDWSGLHYIDLQAGPGKNDIGGNILLGSPLLAMTLEHPFTRYHFNEMDPVLADALKIRVQASPLRERVSLHQGDLNEVVHTVCDQIEMLNQTARAQGRWGVLAVAFVDPEGLEVEWKTIARLARLSRMDLIINFSTSGIVRLEGASHYSRIDTFMGDSDWQNGFQGDPVRRRRHLIDHYRKKLIGYGYQIDLEETEHHDISFRNTKNTEVYSLIYASKHPLGDKFWRQVRKTLDEQPRLF